MTEIQYIKITESSHLGVIPIPEELMKINFDKLWEIHPPPSSVVIFGKSIEVPRYQESYDQDYEFSGTVRPAVPLPDILRPISEWVDSLGFGKFNQKFANWYLNGNNYIGPHRDDEKQMIPDAPIVSISLGCTRKFRIRDHKTKKIITDIDLQNGSVVIMCGDFQKELTHEIVKVNGKKGQALGKRINLTFRQFK